ncbi:2'-5' RNA ligase family protein [Halococcoides cellulosivorans]|uniref:Phosphoesterase n=1 Tax=Halococcoides cellulosivorans TaxID=1679096 RepID=A0A2R4X023_9EURY|nr:2'-5' RNA ligase family protein [Halococcoides cellulosivorans]AWB27156.1 phosphoesterase [Halococcoides cellulosivorans]
MFSLNVPIPSAVNRIADELAREAPPATVRPHADRTLVLKRLGAQSDAARLSARAREALAGQPPVAARVAGLVVFEDPPAGPAPVVALSVESPGLVALHEQLCEYFDPAEGIEEEAYRPHVTVARGAGAERVRSASIDTHRWSIEELQFYDANRHTPAGRIDLPA